MTNEEWTDAVRAYLAKRAANPDDISLETIAEGLNLLSDDSKEKLLEQFETLMRQRGITQPEWTEGPENGRS